MVRFVIFLPRYVHSKVRGYFAKSEAYDSKAGPGMTVTVNGEAKYGATETLGHEEI